MEPAKKKSKKSFSVPVAKPTSSQEVSSKDENADTDVNKNNNVKIAVSSTASDNDAKKRKKKVEVKKKKDEQENKTDATVDKISKPVKDKNVGKPKVQRSLTDVEYDDLFMAVLHSVMKAEQEGDKSDTEEQVEHVPTANQTDETNENGGDETNEKGDDETIEKGGDEADEKCEESDEDEARSQVIEVTVKVEDLEEQGNFDNIEAEDIDKWESAVANEEISERTEDQSLPEKENDIEPDSTVQSKHKSTSGKQQKIVKNGKLKEKKSSWQKPEVPSSSSESVKTKKKPSPVPSELKKEAKAKVSKKSTSSGEKVGTKAKPTSSKHTEKKSLKQVMLERELEDLGTWVQCGNTSCLKWRYLKNITDPMEIPQRWECSMNTNETCNSCDKPEEDYDESEHIYTKYTEGSVVLAKMAGYPWWPGMIEIDPDYDTYFEVAVPASMYPTKYHVVFFDKNVSRAWISFASIKPFEEIEALPKKCKGHNYTREVNAAIKNAKDALELPIKERLKKFSFGARFSGKWGHYRDKSEHKKRKQRSNGARKHSKNRTLDEDEEQLVDDNTLDKILNNSQSVFSDVVEMLSSIENATFDSDEDPEYKLETHCKKSKTSSVPVQISENVKECSWKVGSVLDEEDETIMDNAVKFEVEELDKDIFTMELGSTHIEDLDIQKAVDECNMEHLDSEFCDVPNQRRDGETSDQNNEVSAVMEVSENEGFNSEIEKSKKKKVTEPLESSLAKGKKKATDGEVDLKKSQAKDEHVKKKKSKKAGEVVIDKSSENKSESIKKKKKHKEETGGLTIKVSEEKEVDTVGHATDGTVKEQKSRKKNKCKLEVNSDSSAGKMTACDTSENTKMEGKEIPEFEDYVEKKKRAKEQSKQRSTEFENSLSVTTEEKDNMSQTKSMSQNEKKKKKSKSTFMNPVQSSDKKDNSQKENKDGKMLEETMSQTSQSGDKLSQKNKRKHKRNKPEKAKTDEETHQNESGDELDLIVDVVGRDSDEDFMLDLIEKRRAAEPASVNVVDDDDSEPLDFEE